MRRQTCLVWKGVKVSSGQLLKFKAIVNWALSGCDFAILSVISLSTQGQLQCSLKTSMGVNLIL